MRSHSGRNLIPVVAAFLVFAIAPSLFAQEAPPMPEPVDPETVTEEQIEATARAYVVVAELREDFELEAQQVESPEQFQEIQLRVEQEMVEAIEAEGLTPDLYNGIIMAANENEELLEQLMAQIALAQQQRG